MTQQHIKWHYVPPHASHMAGAWERLIGSTKRILRALADQQRLTDESLLSFMCEAERIMNDRPITSSDDPNSPPLTPSMLLTGRNNQTSLTRESLKNGTHSLGGGGDKCSISLMYSGSVGCANTSLLCSVDQNGPKHPPTSSQTTSCW